MKLGFKKLILFFFISNILLGNISSIENNFTFALFTLNKDTTFKDSISIPFESGNSKDKFKSPVKAMLYSAFLPGLGQTYLGKWKRGLIYLTLEGIAAGVWYQNNLRADERKNEYKSYAADHWDFSRWIHDYYKWEPLTPPNSFSGPDSLWHSIREVFVNNTDEDCINTPYCYLKIWQHGHSVIFNYDDGINGSRSISSRSNEFQEVVFKELCGNSSVIANCSNTIEEVENKISQHSVNVIEDHDFYEGIQKYSMYFAGWDDTDNLKLTDSGNNNIIISSPNQSAYQSIYTRYNDIKKLAGGASTFMLINRFVSMIDGLFLAKKWNTEHIVDINLDIYPDLRNKSGVGGVKLTMGWK